MNISLNGIKVLLIIIYVGLISIALSLFLIFLFGHADEKKSFYYDTWRYFESEIFRAIIVSFAIPIILLVLEYKFNIIQDFINIRQQRQEQALKEYNDRRKQAEEERRERQLDAINKTIDMFKQVNLIVSKTRFYDPNSAISINNILIDLTSISVILADVINTWNHRFPNYSSNILSLFADYVRLLYWSAWAVAHFIQNKLYTSVEQVREIQEHLAMVQRGTVSIAFSPILNSMKHTNDLLELINELSNILETGEEFKKTSYLLIRNKIIDSIRKEIKEYINSQFKENSKVNIYNIANKEGNINIPLNIIWNECKKKLDNDYEKIYNKNIFDSLNNQLSGLAKKNHDDINNESLIPIEIKETMSKNIKKIIENLVKLKIYQKLLKIDKFTQEEIFSFTDMVEEEEESIKLRTKFKNLNLYVNMKSGITNIENSNSKLFFASYQFNDFKDSFFGSSDLHLMNIIAVDTIKRMKEIGKKMRFASIIAVDDINLESTQ